MARYRRTRRTVKNPFQTAERAKMLAASPNARHWERRYDSLEAFLAIMDGKEDALRARCSSAVSGDFSFTGTEDLAAAVTLARYGWPEGSRRVRELADGLRDNLEAHVTRQRAYHDHEGADVDVGRYLQHEPECMINYRPRDGKGTPVISIAVNCSISGGAHRETIEARGAAIAALCDLVEASGARAELWAGSLTIGSHGDTYAQRVKIKAADEPLDVDRVAFAFAHPSFLRRLSFAERDLASDDAQRAAMGYGGHNG